MLTIREKLKLLRIAICIIVCHVIMGILQEKILKRPYSSGEKEERFTLPIAYVAAQCFSYAIIAKGAILFSKNYQKNEVPQRYYAIPAIFFLSAMICSNAALRFISYPTQVVAKACKPIAVMLLGVFIGRKSYTLQKYIFVILIVIGVIIFSLKPTTTDASNNNENDHYIIGMILISSSLLFDGLMGALQDRMRSVSMPTTLNLMFYLNAWSSLYLCALLIFTLEGVEFINFCIRHPRVLIDLTVVIFVGSVAQFFISQMVSLFGALPLSLVLTVRKFITVFLSVIIWQNVLGVRQWIAAVVIFSALILDAVIDPKKKSDTETPKHQEEEIKEVVNEEVEEPKEVEKMLS